MLHLTGFATIEVKCTLIRKDVALQYEKTLENLCYARFGNHIFESDSTPRNHPVFVFMDTYRKEHAEPKATISLHLQKNNDTTERLLDPVIHYCRSSVSHFSVRKVEEWASAKLGYNVMVKDLHNWQPDSQHVSKQ